MSAEPDEPAPTSSLLDREENLAAPRRWVLHRAEDATGVSGTGVVATGIQFPDGTVAYRWTTNPATTQFAGCIENVQLIHGHGGKSQVRWLD